MLFLLGDTESSESNDPDLVMEGADGEENSSGLGKKDGTRISLVCLFETCMCSKKAFKTGSHLHLGSYSLKN